MGSHRASAQMLCLGFVLIIAATRPIFAASNVDIHYAITYLTIPIGSGAWKFAIDGDQYAMSASGLIKGMMSLLIDGEGRADARGGLLHGYADAGSFDARVMSATENDDIHVVFKSGAVEKLVAQPPFPPLPKRIPLTENDLQRVVDPLNASFVVAHADDSGLKICNRRLPIFDGRRRYDVALSFGRIEQITIPPGYRGAAIVCSARTHSNCRPGVRIAGD